MTPLPTFSNIQPETIEPTLSKILADNLAALDQLLTQPHLDWNNFIEPWETLNETLHNYWAQIHHLNAVVSSEPLRQAHNACLPKLSDYANQISHNEKLYNALLTLKKEHYAHLNPAQQKVIDNEIRDFKLAGVALSPEKKAQFSELTKQLSQLTNQFEENLLDATDGWYQSVTDEKELGGLPAHVIAAAKKTAEDRQLPGWVFTLEFPVAHAVMQYSDSENLRHNLYHAYVTRASDQGPNAKKWDNTDVMNNILNVRLALSKLLNFENSAEHSLATRMAKTSENVIDFLQQLIAASHKKAEQEFKELSEFSKRHLGLPTLNAWNVAYASEKLREQEYSISEEIIRQYFPAPQAMQGLFTIVKKLFGITLKKEPSADVWHPDVECYALYDASGQLRSYCYFDLYARPHKRGGAWMDDCRGRRKKSDGTVQIPIAFVTCNFTPALENQPALLNHEEILTLLHEFGHALQHMLTTVDYLAISGINGIAWDAVELPSQFFENWGWQQSSLQLMSKHYKTGEPLPNELFNKMIRAKNFQAAMQMVRQLEYALFDFRLHVEFNPVEIDQIQKILDEVRQQVAVIRPPDFNRFQHGFSHIFAGGYAAGYYSYKWAEVMAADAFSLFEEQGLFDRNAADAFLHCILEPGGSEDPAVLFRKFRGRDPQINALLKQEGIL